MTVIFCVIAAVPELPTNSVVEPEPDYGGVPTGLAAVAGLEEFQLVRYDCHTAFFTDQLWCETGPGQDLLWDDYPSGFQSLLRKYSANYRA